MAPSMSGLRTQIPRTYTPATGRAAGGAAEAAAAAAAEAEDGEGEGHGAEKEISQESPFLRRSTSPEEEEGAPKRPHPLLRRRSPAASAEGPLPTEAAVPPRPSSTHRPP